MRGGSYIWTLRVSWLLRYARKPDAIAVASRANSCVTKRQIKHVCNDAQACGRVAEIAGMVNIVGASVGASKKQANNSVKCVH